MRRHLIKQVLSNLKATRNRVAFFILFIMIYSNSFALPIKNELTQKKFPKLKMAVTHLIVEKNRTAALLMITNTETEAVSADIKTQLRTLKENILSLFLTQESQDFFEASASQIIAQPRSAEKNMTACLNLEPQNLYCRWQQLRILKYTSDQAFQETALRFTKDTENLFEFKLLASTLDENASYKDDILLGLEKSYPVLFLAHEYQKSLVSKNYSLAKDVMQKILNVAPDYPDLIYMRARLALLSQETSVNEQSSDVLYTDYRKICASLRPQLTRKYFYDINLCHRSL
jgi:hypothetical protein